MILSTFSYRLSRPTVALGAALAVAMTTTAPAPARADRAGAVIGGAILGAAIICAANPKACGGGRKGGRSGGGGGGPADAIAMTRDQKMMVQGGLQNMGFYTGALDGAIGAGTRNSIRNYQTAIGASATGRLTGAQINDLVALSPRFVGYAIGDVYLFNADIAPDLDREGIRQLQAALNGAGYHAGPVDGAMGGKTREAIRRYKMDNRLPGGVLPTRRLLAHIRGMAAPRPAGLEMAARKPAGFDAAPGYVAGMDGGYAGGGYAGGGYAPAGGAQVPVASPVPTPLPSSGKGRGKAIVAPVAMDMEFDILGAKLGSDAGTLDAVLKVELGGDLMTVFKEHVLPEMLAYYGDSGRVGDSLTWIGNGEARTAALSDPAALAACGDLRVASVPEVASGIDGLWSKGHGITMDSASLDSVAKSCGTVVKVRFQPGLLTIGLWNSDVLSGGGAAGAAAIPRIKF